MRVPHASQAGISLIIQSTVSDAQVPQECPHLRIPPFQHWMYTHEWRPAAIGGVKSAEVFSVWVRPARTHKDGADGLAWWRGEIRREGLSHARFVAGGGGRLACEGETVARAGEVDEGVNGGEWVGVRNVDRREGVREVGMLGEEREVEQEEDEAVFAAVVGEGEAVEAGVFRDVGLALKRSE